MDPTLKAVQADLITLGFLPKGADDGRPGNHTTRALKHFQRRASTVYRLSSATNLADDVSDAEVFDGEVTGECWFVQAGRQSDAFRFRGIPGPRPTA